jgi:DNA-binding NarL/FixJ family response regulator
MQTIRVLIVDDMPQVRQDLRTVLQLAGQQAGTPVEILAEAADGHQAVQQASALRPDVVIMDLEMPVLDGYAATREIKANFPGMGVLVLTVHDDEIDHKKASQAGVDGFIVKGTPVAEIIHQINLLVQKGEN